MAQGILTRYQGPQFDHKGRIVADWYTIMNEGPAYGASYMVNPNDEPVEKAREVLARYGVTG